MAIARLILKGVSLALLGGWMGQPSFVEAIVAKRKAAEDPKLTFLATGAKFEQDGQFEKALQYYQAAALLGDAEAWNRITALTAKIRETQNQKQAQEEKQVLERSARRGNAMDALRLAQQYFTEKKIDKSVEMFNLAIQNKSSDAAFALAKMYETGDHVPRDFAKAEKCYEQGAQNGHPECAYMWAKLLELKARDAGNPQEKDKFSKEALRWMKEAADRGHAKAAFELAQTMAFMGQITGALSYMEKVKKTAQSGVPVTMDLKKLANFCEILVRVGMNLLVPATASSGQPQAVPTLATIP